MSMCHFEICKFGGYLEKVPLLPNPALGAPECDVNELTSLCWSIYLEVIPFKLHQEAFKRPMITLL